MEKKLIISVVLMLGSLSFSFGDDNVIVKSTQDNLFKSINTKYLSDNDKLQWVNEMRKRLPIVQRKRGPFGLSQDPNAKKAAIVLKKVKKNDSFAKAIKAMKVTVVSGNFFYCDGFEFKQGGRYDLKRGEEKFKIEVVSVNQNKIVLYNVDTSERAVKQLMNQNQLPSGVKPSVNTSFKGIDGVSDQGARTFEMNN